MTTHEWSEAFIRAREWLKERWQQEHPNEAHCQQLADYEAHVLEVLNRHAYKVGVAVGKAENDQLALQENQTNDTTTEAVDRAQCRSHRSPDRKGSVMTIFEISSGIFVFTGPDWTFRVKADSLSDALLSGGALLAKIEEAISDD